MTGEEEWMEKHRYMKGKSGKAMDTNTGDLRISFLGAFA